jgi:hypothetical protein
MDTIQQEIVRELPEIAASTFESARVMHYATSCWAETQSG